MEHFKNMWALDRHMSVRDPYGELRSSFIDVAAQALKDLGSETGPVVEVPRTVDADLCLVCFPLAKPMKMRPDGIAQKVKDLMDGRGPWKLEVSGGYLNCTFDPVPYTVSGASGMMEWTEGPLLDLSACGPVVIEHTSANPNGPFHVGRARNPIIGDTLVRMFRLSGVDVEAQYWVNDMGKQVMILVWGIHNIDPGTLDTPEREKEDHLLVRSYQAANALMENDASLEGEINSMLLRYENAVSDGDLDRTISGEGRSAIRASDVRDACERVLEGMKGSLSALNVSFDRFVYESAVVEDGSLVEVVEGLKRSPLCRKEEGAFYLDLSEMVPGGGDDERFRKRFVFTRSDGSALYTTRDLAYHRWKLDSYDKVINVLGEDHRYQSTMLRLALAELGSARMPEAIFYSFVSLPEGKMSTRRNRVVFLDDLLDEAVERSKEEVLKRRGDLSDAEVEAIARAVGIGALRFNMVRVQPEKQIVFRWEEALNFEGASAPFVQYSNARACSILQKAGGAPEWDMDWSKLVERSERSLVKTLSRLPSVLRECVEGRKPHLMTGYLVEAASAFNEFYRDCPVLHEHDQERRKARTALCSLSGLVLRLGLGSLGIEAPQRM